MMKIKNNISAKAAIFVKPGTELDREPLLCFGANVRIGDADGNIGRLYATPSGHIVAADVTPSIEKAKALRAWDCAKLDEIAEDYFYEKDGTALRLIDLMAKEGHLTFSDSKRFVFAVNDNLRTGQFIIISETE